MLLFTKFNICDIIYMMKIKFLSKFVILPLILLLSGVILFACGEKKIDFQYSISGNGAVIESGTNQFTAVADDWHEFVGWYNGNVKYSSNQTITIKSSTPKLQARFSSSGKATMDRHLKSFYNSYVDEERGSGEYFNYSLDGYAQTLENNISSGKAVDINGYIDFGSSSNFSFEFGDFGFYYVDNSQNGTLYIQIGEDKYSYTDMGLLTNIFTSLAQPSSFAWSLDNLISSENTKYLINQYFGIKNSMGFISSVENKENSSILTLSYHRILAYLQNIADSSSDATTLQKLIHALTCEYQNANLPEMTLTFITNYLTTSNREFVKDIEINFSLNNDYVINFDGNKKTLPKMDVNFKIDSFDYGYSDQANAISSSILDSFPEPTVNMINVHADGELDFLSVSSETSTVVDKYKIQIDADLNPLALVSFKKNKDVSYHDIEWEKLGFLSFRVYLDPSTAVLDRHNNVSDYVNILIDTKNNGANAYVFIGLYNPLTLFTQSYIYNHSFNIPGLISILEGDSTSESQKASSNTIMNIIMAIIGGGMELASSTNPNEIIKDLVVDLLNSLNVNTEVIDNNLTNTEDGINLSLAEIRTEIRNYEKDIIRSTLGIGNTDIELDKIIFGDDEDGITHLAINMNVSKTNVVLKNQDGDYLSADGEVIADYFNTQHTLVSQITEISLPISAEEILALKGSLITATQGKLSDGTTTTIHINNKGKEKPLEMVVEDVQIKDGKVRMLLRFIDYPNSLSSLPKIGDEIYELSGIPYGLILYETTL